MRKSKKKIKKNIRRVGFDVFLCHNSQDKKEVTRVAEALRLRGIRPWFDAWHLAPGTLMLLEIEIHLGKVKSAAVFVGRGGIGPWQRVEMYTLLTGFIERGVRVIPVLLPGCADPPQLPVVLGGLRWVDFRSSWADG